MAPKQIDEEQIFKSALKIDAEIDRLAFIQEACGEDTALLDRIKALLQAHARADDFLENPHTDPALALQQPHGIGPGTLIDHYKLLENIGEGGMATVYMAEQTQPIHRRVALKLIKPGMDTQQVIARFEAERQALALMDHPNIARVLDAGTTESGRPYFVMELVKGISITEFCDRNNLSTKDRLVLFISVCQAVHHAHQKGIIHRDIKPSNVLVTLHDGVAVPKVIDFGIAKAVNQQLTEKTLFTRFAQMIGTPEYMSPEQAEMSGLDIDIRTDVFSLGVLLYELLTGTTPFDAEYLLSKGYAEIQRIICKEEPAKPSTKISTLGKAATDIAKSRRTSPDGLLKLIRSDLDWITMKTLEKDRNRRYDSVSELAADIKRHLNQEPVLAGPPSALYRIRKFVQRRKTLVTTTSVMLAAILTALVFSILKYVRADRALKRESSALSETQSVVNFLTDDLLASVYPEKRKGQEVTIRYLLDTASANLKGEFADNPLVEAVVRTTLGLTYQKMGDYSAAEPHLKWALETRERVLGLQHRDTLQSMCDLAWQYVFQGRVDEAEATALSIIETGRQALGQDHAVVLSAMQCCGFMYVVGFQSTKAEPMIHEGYETSLRVLGEEHQQTVAFMNLLAWLYDLQGRQPETLETAIRALDISRRVLGQEHPHTIQATNQLGRVYTVEGRFEEAEVLLRESIELGRQVLGERHLFTVWYMERLASLYRAMKDHPNEEDTTAKALEIARRVPGKLMVTGYLHWRLWQRVVALSADAREQYDAGRYDEAVSILSREERLRQSLDHGYTKLTPPDVSVLAMSLHRSGRHEEASDTLQRLREMLEAGEYTYEEQNLYEAETLFAGTENELAGVWNLLAEGRLEAVFEYLKDSYPSTSQNAQTTIADVENLRRSLARAYCVRGCRAEGVGAYKKAIQDYEAAIQTNPGCVRAHNRLARLLAVCHLVEVRDGVRSVEHATKACELTGWENPSFISTLAAAHADSNEFSMAIQFQQQAIDLLGEHERDQWLPDYEMRRHLYEAGQPYRWSMIAHWTFDQSKSEIVLDSSGNDLNGHTVGNAHIIDDADRQGQVLCLDGDDDWVDCGNDATLGMVSEITVACWIKAASKKYGAAILCSGDNAWLLGRYLDSDHLEFSCDGVTISHTMSGSVTGEIDVNDNRWYHVVGVYDGTTMRLYIDGKLDVSSEASGRIKGTPFRVLIGENDVLTTVFGRERSFKGLIDDVRIYNYALSEAEIEAIYRDKSVSY